jgi:hypothetical protein
MLTALGKKIHEKTPFVSRIIRNPPNTLPKTVFFGGTMCIIEKRYFEKRTMCIIEESFDVQNRFSKSPQGDLIPEIAEIPSFLAIIPLLQHVNDALEIPP